MFWLLACNCTATGPLVDDSELVTDSPDETDPDDTEPDSEGPEDTGPIDPGAPTFPETVDIVHVTVGIADTDFAGTDDGLEACFSEDRCFTLAKPDWNDNERGEVDVHIVEGFDMPRTEVDRFVVRTMEGGDRFEPVCFALAMDGEPMACQPVTGFIGTDDADEFPEWSGLFEQNCMGCWETPLTHGPYLGGDGDLWFRTDATRRVVVLSGPDADSLTAHTILYPSASEDFASQVHLGPGAHAVQFRIDDWTSEVFTLVAPQSIQKLAFGSCSKDEDQPILADIQAWDPDLCLFIGDNHYANSSDLGALRAWYRWSLDRPGRTELMQASSVLATWDDHDFTGNNTDGSEPGKDVALRAFTEYWANPSYGTEDVAGVFTRQDYGNVEVFLVDDRYWRGFDDSMLGDAQQAWLVEALKDSTADWKVVACGSQWTSEGSSDSWAAFDDAREEVFAEMSAIGGVVLLSGDIHRSEFRSLSTPGYALPEITSSPLATWNSGCKSDDEQLVCFDEGTSWVGLEIGQTDLTAKLFDADGNTVYAWTIELSALQP